MSRMILENIIYYYLYIIEDLTGFDHIYSIFKQYMFKLTGFMKGLCFPWPLSVFEWSGVLVLFFFMSGLLAWRLGLYS